MKREHFTCTVDQCGKPHRAKGYCDMHYTRLQRGSHMDKLPKQPCKGLRCSAENCPNPMFSKGLCKFHYQRKRLGIPFTQIVPVRDRSNKY